MLDEVLKLYNRGLAVFPVSNESKTPLVQWGKYQDELPTEQEVIQWFSLNNRSVGVATGPTSNIFLLDFDFAKHPEAKEFYDSHTFPRTWTEETKSKGLHLYFKWDSRLDAKQTNTASKIWSGVDTKGKGGYSKICPSAGYEWIVAPHMSPLASAPQWLIDLLPDKGSREINAGFVNTLETIKEGSRNNGFTSLAGSLRAVGCNAEKMFELLEPKAKELNFPLEELRLVCNSVGRYPTNVPVTIDGQGESIETFLADRQEVKWIGEPFIAEESIGFIAGLPESRKSWILIDLAIECARGGGLWLNKFPVKAAKVLLIDQERSKSEIQRRLQAVLAGKELLVQDISKQLFVRSGTSTRIDLQHSYDALRKELSDLRPSLILIDSFATFHTKSENNRQEIQIVMERIKEIRNEFKCSIILIHHETKQAYQNKKDGAESSYLDMAGNVAIPAAAEFCMNIVCHDSESSFAHHTKSTQGSKMPPFLVKVTDVLSDRSKIRVEAY